MVLRDFQEHGTIEEKHDRVTAKSDLRAGVTFFYESDEVGFGWTNAAFLVPLGELSPQAREQFIVACEKAGSPGASCAHPTLLARLAGSI